MKTTMKLGILDLAGAIEDSVELAPLAEQLGYSRYWIAEHQPQPSPILITSIIAGITDEIRVGTAGILFHYYSPLRAAHDFHFLERLYGERIDAGFCAGIVPGEDRFRDDAEERDMARVIAHYDLRVERLVAHLRNVDPEGPDSRWPGAPDTVPAIWYLGGSARAGSRAGGLGVNFAYAFMFPWSRDEGDGIAAYRDAFVADGDLSEPYSIVSVTGVCAATDAEAKKIAALSDGKFFDPKVVGDPKRCADELEGIRERFGADEVVFADLCRGFDGRRACYELLAKEAF